MTLDTQERERLARLNYETEKDGVFADRWDQLPWGTRERKMRGIDAVVDELTGTRMVGDRITVRKAHITRLVHAVRRLEDAS